MKGALTNGLEYRIVTVCTYTLPECHTTGSSCVLNQGEI